MLLNIHVLAVVKLNFMVGGRGMAAELEPANVCWDDGTEWPDGMLLIPWWMGLTTYLGFHLF